MVAKSKTGAKEQKRGKVKVGKLKLNKETVKDLSDAESKKIKGGIGGCTYVCNTQEVCKVSRPGHTG